MDISDTNKVGYKPVELETKDAPGVKPDVTVAEKDGPKEDGLSIAKEANEAPTSNRLLGDPRPIDPTVVLPTAMQHVTSTEWKTLALNEATQLDPTKFPDSIGLGTLFAAFANGPQRDQIVQQILNSVAGLTGQRPSPALIAMALRKPDLVLRLAVLTPAQMSGAIGELNRAYQAGQVPPDAPAKHLLPQHLDMDSFDVTSIKVPEFKLKELAPGLYHGELPSDLPSVQKQQNLLLAETLDRLASNFNGGDPFSVTYRGVPHTTLESFLDALRDAGHEVEVGVRLQGADLGDLKVDIGGEIKSVAAPVFSLTSAADADGAQAIVPVPHAGISISIRPGKDTSKDDAITGDASFYQGLGGTGIHAPGLTKSGSWIGGNDLLKVRGDTAITMLRRIGKQAAVTQAAAKSLNLRSDAYGLSGNCIDSVMQPFAQLAAEAADSDDIVLSDSLRSAAELFGTGTDAELLAALREGIGYPMLMQDEIMQGEISKILQKGDDADLSVLEQSLLAVPNDIVETEGSLKRALATLMLVWPDGEEPMPAIVHAKEVLRAKLGLKPGN